jgi:hypothetical protein
MNSRERWRPSTQTRTCSIPPPAAGGLDRINVVDANRECAVLEEFSGTRGHSLLGDGVPVSRLRHATGAQVGSFGMRFELDVWTNPMLPQLPSLRTRKSYATLD